MSANNKDDNKLISGSLHRPCGIDLTAKENLSYGTVDEDCATSHHLKWDSLHANELGRIALNYHYYFINCYKTINALLLNIMFLHRWEDFS